MRIKIKDGEGSKKSKIAARIKLDIKIKIKLKNGETNEKGKIGARIKFVKARCWIASVSGG